MTLTYYQNANLATLQGNYAHAVFQRQPGLRFGLHIYERG